MHTVRCTLERGFCFRLIFAEQGHRLIRDKAPMPLEGADGVEMTKITPQTIVIASDEPNGTAIQEQLKF